MIPARNLVLLLAPLALTACGGKGPRMDGPDGPHGGSRAELLYQSALKLSEKGYCDKAMPVFVCLASQGHGWEVAAQRAGQCAPSAAKLWKPPMEDDQVMRKDANGKTLPPDGSGIGKDKFEPGKIRFHYAWESTPDAIRAEGKRQLKRAAAANWPSSQVLLVQELAALGDAKSLTAAAIWLNRYDNNPRRKVYGGDDVSLKIRKQLAAILLPKQKSVWHPSVFAAEAGQNAVCDRVLGMRQHPHRPKSGNQDGDDDGVIRLPEEPDPFPGNGGGSSTHK